MAAAPTQTGLMVIDPDDGTQKIISGLSGVPWMQFLTVRKEAMQHNEHIINQYSPILLLGDYHSALDERSAAHGGLVLGASTAKFGRQPQTLSVDNKLFWRSLAMSASPDHPIHVMTEHWMEQFSPSVHNHSFKKSKLDPMHAKLTELIFEQNLTDKIILSGVDVRFAGSFHYFVLESIMCGTILHEHSGVGLKSATEELAVMKEYFDELNQNMSHFNDVDSLKRIHLDTTLGFLRRHHRHPDVRRSYIIEELDRLVPKHISMDDLKQVLIHEVPDTWILPLKTFVSDSCANPNRWVLKNLQSAPDKQKYWEDSTIYIGNALMDILCFLKIMNQALVQPRSPSLTVIYLGSLHTKALSRLLLSLTNQHGARIFHNKDLVERRWGKAQEANPVLLGRSVTFTKLIKLHEYMTNFITGLNNESARDQESLREADEKQLQDERNEFEQSIALRFRHKSLTHRQYFQTPGNPKQIPIHIPMMPAPPAPAPAPVPSLFSRSTFASMPAPAPAPVDEEQAPLSSLLRPYHRPVTSAKINSSMFSNSDEKSAQPHPNKKFKPTVSILWDDDDDVPPPLQRQQQQPQDLKRKPPHHNPLNFPPPIPMPAPAPASVWKRFPAAPAPAPAAPAAPAPAPSLKTVHENGRQYIVFDD